MWLTRKFISIFYTTFSESNEEVEEFSVVFFTNVQAFSLILYIVVKYKNETRVLLISSE